MIYRKTRKKCILTLFFVLLIFFRSNISALAESQSIVKVYRYKRNENMQIALTFDDGPHPIYTEKILDILEKYKIKATFFMVGENILYYTAAAIAVKEHGHEIGNHTKTHKSDLSETELMREIISCSEIIFNTLDCETTIIRPPKGLILKSTLKCCSMLEYSIILWNIDTRDWAQTPANEIYKNVTENIDPGDIILMHDYISRRSPTPEALELIIPELLSRGYKFVTVSELIGEEIDTNASARKTTSFSEIYDLSFMHKKERRQQKAADVY